MQDFGQQRFADALLEIRTTRGVSHIDIATDQGRPPNALHAVRADDRSATAAAIGADTAAAVAIGDARPIRSLAIRTDLVCAGCKQMSAIDGSVAIRLRPGRIGFGFLDVEP